MRIRVTAALLACVSAVGLGTATVGGTAAPARAAEAIDGGWDMQWGPKIIKADQAWAVSTGRNIRVAVIDTGVNLTHQDLVGHIAASTTCVNTGGSMDKCAGDGEDDVGHGTHVAGIIAATRDNGVGIRGVAPDAKLVVAKVLVRDGQGGASGTIDDIEAGIHWAVEVQHAQVVNLSLGAGTLVSSILGGNNLGDAIEFAWAHGAIPVLAAGNQNFFGLGSANYGTAHAVVVGATGPDDQVATYSSPTGDARWAVVAPGGNASNCASPVDQNKCVLSTWWDGKADSNEIYAYDQGTSMAAPHVSAVLALLLAKGFSPQQAVDRLLSTVDTGVSCGVNSTYCRGRIDAAAAVNAPAHGTPTTVKATGGTKSTVRVQGPTTTVARAGGTPTTAAAPSVPATTAPSIPPSTTFTRNTTRFGTSDVATGPIIARDRSSGINRFTVGMVAAAALLAVCGMLLRNRRGYS